jgi:uncharacterized protein YndB with AHSA1/START domain
MGKKRDLVVARVFDAPIERLWNAWTDPEDVRRWWGPEGFTCPVAEMDVREGGTSLVAMRSPEHGQHYSTWRYRTVAPLERLAFVHNLADADGNAVDPVAMGMPPDFPREQLQEVTFRSLGVGVTELTVTEFDWDEGGMMELARLGLQQSLDKLAVVVTKAARDAPP